MRRVRTRSSPEHETPNEEEIPYAESGVPFDDDSFGITESEAEERYIRDAAVDQLQQLGIMPRKCPVIQDVHVRIYGDEFRVGEPFDGRLPHSFRNLETSQVMELYALFSNWHAYLVHTGTTINTERVGVSHQKDLIWSMLRMRHLKAAKKIGENLSDQRLSDLARYDSRFVEWNARYVRLQALREGVEAIRSVAEKDMEVISREITARGQTSEFDHRRRGFNKPDPVTQERMNSERRKKFNRRTPV